MHQTQARQRRTIGALLALVLGATPGLFACDEAASTQPLGGDAARPSDIDGWKARRTRIDQTLWADGVIAQQYERTLVALWDALLAAKRRGADADKLKILSSLRFEELTVGDPQQLETLDHGIERFELSRDQRVFVPGTWAAHLNDLFASGLRLVQSEWHHARFQPATGDEPARSKVAVVLHVRDAVGGRRFIVDGELDVAWSDQRDAAGNPLPAKIDASDLQMLARTEAPAFESVLRYASPQRTDPYAGIHPVLLYDLDKDGLTDIVAVRSARVLWNRGADGFREAPLLERPYVLTEAGLIADMNGDAHPDLVATRARGDLVIYFGNAEGRFLDEPRVTPHFEEPLLAPSVITAGDIDGDGDLDLWLAQYKPAYQGGQMPSPYYDANDGYPAYLLVNDGLGNLTAQTHGAGLDAKRYRRTYASSFFDLDGDRDLDLLVVSDYSGIDLFHNDGSGHFVDANHTLDADRHLFGMSASFADYDLDGRLDFFVAGMASTTARRLEALGLWRDDEPGAREMRMRMAFGNRMYLATDSGWSEPAFRAEVARTGWTWGTTAFDFDNDGDPDIFAANGHQSGESTADYCETFWSHDIYDGQSQPDGALAGLFDEASRGVASGAESWDGYQKNHLLMNRAGVGFTNIAFLLGVADEFDSRSALSADFDRDGRVDLVVTEDLGAAGRGEILHVYRNRLETDHHWIGVVLQEQGGGISPVGASVSVRTPGRTQVARVMTGEALMGQHAPTLHFGLGDAERVEVIEVLWLDGSRQRVRDPELDRYHLVLATPVRNTGTRSP